MTDHLLVCDPGARLDSGTREQRAVLEGVAGKVIGFIDNAKPNFNHLVDDLAQLLVGRYGAAGVLKHRKAGQVPVAQDALADIVRRCDAVITGSGD
jgi:hypothetical protein